MTYDIIVRGRMSVDQFGETMHQQEWTRSIRHPQFAILNVRHINLLVHVKASPIYVHVHPLIHLFTTLSFEV